MHAVAGGRCSGAPQFNTGHPFDSARSRLSVPDESVAATTPTESVLRAYRGEIIEAAQQRDRTRIKMMVSTLVQRHRLTAHELDMCLVLHHVAWMGEDLNSTSKYLISLGCNPFFRDPYGDTVFHYTVRGCNLSLLKYLVYCHGVRAFKPLNNQHFTLFLTVAAETSVDSISAFLTLLEWLYLHGCSIESQDVNGATGLMWACRRGCVAAVQWFLSHGANLSHRDHNGRTPLHMACLSGDEDTLRTVCETGAIRLLECESNDDSQLNTALNVCWTKGHYFLWVSLLRWNISKQVFGRIVLFKNTYARYYWMIMIWNLLVFMALASTFWERPKFSYNCFVFLTLFVLTQMYWIIAFTTDPGYVKPSVIPDQEYRCSSNIQQDVNQHPVLGYRPGSACHQLQKLEMDLDRLGLTCIQLKRENMKDYGHHHGSSRIVPTTSTMAQYRRCLDEIQQLRDQMYQLMPTVGQERRLVCPKDYTYHVLEGNPKKVCLTCRIIKPFRAHHCAECSRCIRRFDHHCVWIDNCVGEGNQRSFQLFLLFLVLTIVELWFTLALYYKKNTAERLDDDNRLDILSEPLLYIALTNALLNFVWAAFVGYLFVRTFKSMLTNVTFYEYLKKPAHIRQRFHGRVNVWLWDLRDLTFWKAMRNIYGYCSRYPQGNHEEDYPDCKTSSQSRLLSLP